MRTIGLRVLLVLARGRLRRAADMPASQAGPVDIKMNFEGKVPPQSIRKCNRCRDSTLIIPQSSATNIAPELRQARRREVR